MTINLKDFVALITGSSSGMGYEMAKALLEYGATVIIAARPGQKLDHALKSLKDDFENVYALPLDVSSETSINQAFDWFKEHFDHLDMLVNNAGIGSNAPGMENLPTNPNFFDIPIKTVKAVLDTNILGHFMMSAKFVPMMVEQGKGRLVYVSTSTATMTRPGQLPYGPSKAAAEAMTTIMAEELRDTGVTVNVICPGGFTDTGMAGAGVKAYFEQNKMPILPPTVMNKMIVFLASTYSDHIIGEKIIGKDFEQWLQDNKINFDI